MKAIRTLLAPSIAALGAVLWAAPLWAASSVLLPSPSSPLPYAPDTSDALTTEGSRSPAAPSVLFRGEFSRNEIYAGEQVMVNFVVYSQEDVLDVEVAKFPEFRGFWSENFSLRQGPIPLMGGLAPQNSFEIPWKKAIIGSYLLASMLGKESPQLIPMKIVIRRAGDEISDNPEGMGETHECAYDTLKIKKLPPLPAGMDPKSFLGAVGSFSLLAETTEIPFEKDEPTTIRLTLQGEGNFQELNRLGLPKVEGLEVLSERSSVQGSGQYTRKLFETTVRAHQERSFQLPSFPFVYFNPALGRYASLTVPPLNLRFVPTPPQPKAEGEPLFQSQADESWSASTPIEKRVGFWLAHLVLALTAIGFVASRTVPEWRARRRSRPEYHRGLKFEEALRHRRAGEADRFLRVADELALELLAARMKLPRHVTRQRALAAAQKACPPEVVSHAKKIFDAYEALRYSPAHAAPGDTAALQESLAFLMRQDKRAA